MAPLTPGLAAAGPSSPVGGDAAAPQGPDGWWVWWDWNREAFFEQTFVAGGPRSPRGDREADLAVTREVVERRIAPALGGVLDADPDRHLLHASLLAFGDTGAAGRSLSGDDGLESLLEHADVRRRWTSDNALTALGRYAHAGSARFLERVLHADEGVADELGGKRPLARTRAFAALALGDVALRSEHPDVRRFALGSLARAVSDRRGEAPVAATAVVALAAAAEASPALAAECARVVPEPWSWFADEDLDLRVRAHVPRLVAALAPALEDVAALATRLAGALDGDPRAELEVGLVQALGSLRVGDEELAGRLAGLLVAATDDGSPRARALAWIALGRRASLPHGALARDALVRAAARPTATRAPWIALGLGVHADAEHRAGRAPTEAVLEALRVGLRRARALDRTVAWALAVGLARDAASTTAIAARLREAGPGRERTALTLALGLTRDHDAVATLREVAHAARHDLEGLEAVAIALGLVGDGERARFLLEGLEDACCARAVSAHARALGRVGDGRLVGPLLDVLGNEKLRDVDRAWGAHALGRLARGPAPTTRARLGAGLNYHALYGAQHAGDGSGALDQR